MTDDQVCRSVAVVLLWVCGFTKVPWLRMAVAEQNRRQIGRGGQMGCFCLFQGFCWHLHTSCLPLGSRRVAKSYVNVPRWTSCESRMLASSAWEFLICTRMNIAELISIAYLDSE